MQQTPTKRAFTVVELIVVISIIAILSGVLVPRVTDHLKSARDARRLADVKQVRNAIEQFYMDKGRYPTADANPSYGGWDVSHDGNFIRELRDEGYLEEDAVDPINDTTFHYRFYVYEKGSYGCQGEGPFYVLGVRNFENTDFASRNKGFFRCSERNWGSEFAFVTGGGATFRD
jgi:prepilin-type N-terminal cleavage/methylation domain-containing protein